jgi:lysyl-tRNA synthetase class 2
VEDCFKKLGLDLRALTDLRVFRETLRSQADLICSTEDSWSDLFFRVWLEKIEPSLSPDRPTLVTGYPTAVSPLSKAQGSSPFSERFEIYWHGMELCNGCSEIADSEILKIRWKEQNNERRARKVPEHPFPLSLYEALKIPTPPVAGVAIGLERLFLCWAKETHQTSANHLL